MEKNSSSSTQTLWIATTNKGKLEELRSAFGVWLGEHPTASRPKGGEWTLDSLPDMASIPECVEDGVTFSANARKKALYYSQFTDGVVLGDDSGLAVDSLGGAPGVRSRRFAGESATDEENNQKLLSGLENVPDPERTAHFICVLAFAQKGELIQEFHGTADGLILRTPKGLEGFGYDPLFLDRATGKSFAELTRDEKLLKSHRGRAVFAMFEWLAINWPLPGK